MYLWNDCGDVGSWISWIVVLHLTRWSAVWGQSHPHHCRVSSLTIARRVGTGVREGERAASDASDREGVFGVEGRIVISVLVVLQYSSLRRRESFPRETNAENATRNANVLSHSCTNRSHRSRPNEQDDDVVSWTGEAGEDAVRFRDEEWGDSVRRERSGRRRGGGSHSAFARCAAGDSADAGSLSNQFELRLLEGKPKPTGATEKRADPFAEPYEAELFVTEEEIRDAGREEGDSFVVLLNKFPVIPRHFLLCTKEFVPQVCPAVIPY